MDKRETGRDITTKKKIRKNNSITEYVPRPEAIVVASASYLALNKHLLHTDRIPIQIASIGFASDCANSAKAGLDKYMGQARVEVGTAHMLRGERIRNKIGCRRVFGAKNEQFS
jgi:hypothetical protein